MSNCASCGVMPCVCVGSFTTLSGQSLAKTLIASLTPVVDQARDIASCLGARPYQVALIWTRWAGGRRGVGVEELLHRELIQPTPLIDDLSRLGTLLQAIGAYEDGMLRCTEISARYTEDHLLGRDVQGREIPDDQSFYWEVYMPTPDGNGIRRRFTPKSAPNLFATKVMWSIDLLKANNDRARSGSLR